METFNAGRRPSFQEQNQREFEWAEKHLPDENPAMVAVTLNMLKLAGEPQTRKNVLRRLELQGRTRAQLEDRN